MTPEQEDFEKWAITNLLDITKRLGNIDGYRQIETYLARQAWKARQSEIDGLKSELKSLRKGLKRIRAEVIHAEAYRTLSSARVGVGVDNFI